MGCPGVQADMFQPDVSLSFENDHIYEEIDDLICENLDHLDRNKETTNRWLPRRDTPQKSNTEKSFTNPTTCADVKSVISTENYYIPMKGTTSSMEKGICVVEHRCPLYFSSAKSKCDFFSTYSSGSEVDSRCTSGNEYVDPVRINNFVSDSTYCIGEYIDSWFVTDRKRPLDASCEFPLSGNDTQIFLGDSSLNNGNDDRLKTEPSTSKARLNSCSCEEYCSTMTDSCFDQQDSSVKLTKEVSPSVAAGLFFDACTDVGNSHVNRSCQGDTFSHSNRNNVYDICDDSYDNNYANFGTYSNRSTYTPGYVLLYNKEREKLSNDKQSKSRNYELGEDRDNSWRRDRELYQVNEFCGNKKKRNSVLRDLILRNNITQI